MFSENISEKAQLRHEQASYFCYEVLQQLHTAEYLADLQYIDYNQLKPGIILRFIYEQDVTYDYNKLKEIYQKVGIISYFDWKLFNKTIHINLKKEYIDKLDELMIVFKIQGVYNNL